MSMAKLTSGYVSNKQTNSRDSGVFFDLDLDFDINVSEKSSTPYKVVLPPKFSPDTDIPFSFYLGLNSQKTTKREHRKSQRITSFYFIDLNSSNDNGLRSMDKTFTPKAG
ncbi:21525_t:CDS:2 [Dentiscutata erythropus]|uniref:21525_t:CDS:1 n=1 Tax=Dentiscutata erythropus TaxID=1348616 RepID=A0A9N8W2M0_9GLOM|nr:21525_t:CDS:2 [Dentiscutata erythropus]